ncbi:MAG: 50S ribosomal protein L4 [Actinomycetota bacterium]
MADALKAPVFGADGKKSEVELPGRFNVEVNPPIMHAVVRAQLAAARAGTHSTKTRAEVSGGGVKPWRQKGTGRARHGSNREPQWVGGGVAHGPKPRDYTMRINKKERALALNSALTVRAREGAVRIVDFPEFAVPETKKAIGLLDQWNARGKVLLVVGPSGSEEIYKSFRNLPNVMSVAAPSAYTVLAADTVVISRPVFEAMAGTAGEKDEADDASDASEKDEADDASASNDADKGGDHE